jgi:hypothetical protein
VGRESQGQAPEAESQGRTQENGDKPVDESRFHHSLFADKQTSFVPKSILLQLLLFLNREQ